MGRPSLAVLGICVFLALWSVSGAAPQQPAPPEKSAPAAQSPAIPAEAPAAQAPAQSQQPPGAVTIKIQSDEVIVPVAVTDDRGLFVRDLERTDFRILDENVPQRITYFNHEPRQPVVVGFLVDLSNSSRIHWNTYKESIKELIWDMISEEKHTAGYLVSYNNDAELVANTTGNGDALAEKVDKLKPGGGAALYDAIVKACRDRSLVKGEPYEPRRIIVVIGDGHDNTSKFSLQETLEIAKRSYTTIFGISTVAYAAGNSNSDILEQITHETGGIVQYPLNNPYRDISGYLSRPSDAGNYVYEAGTGGYAGAITKGIIKAVSAVVGEITTQYVLRYVPLVDPATRDLVFRRIKVDIPSLPNVRIHARDGYYPNKAQAPAAPLSPKN